MSNILVVDDSAVDRRLVGGLLGADDRLKIEYAENGVAALQRLRSQPADLVVTDLIMPEMDGLKLVAEVRANYPLIPVILMTSAGNEEIAVKALKAGAASYVPKRTLAQNLLSTVRDVLSLAGQERTQSKLLDCLTDNSFTLQLKNDRSLVSTLVAFLQDAVTRMGICDDADRMRVGVALEEALLNALYHGNLEVSSQLREDDYAAYQQTADRRSREEPYSSRRIHVRAEMTRAAAQFVIRDEGPGFDPHALPDPTDPANLEKVSGRGVLLMRTFMDSIEYNDLGNEVTLIKRCESDGDDCEGEAAA